MEEIRGRIIGSGFTGELRLDEPLAGHTSLRVGGPASLFALPAGVGDLVLILALLAGEKVPWMVLGGGTNVVFADEGYHGCVIHLSREVRGWGGIRRDKEMLEAGAAALMPNVVSRAAREGLAGLECLADIPGTVGGALRMNAGTRSGQMADVVEQVRLLEGTGDSDGGGQGARWVPGSGIGFAYRSSGLTAGQIVLAVRFRLKPDDPDAVRARVTEQARLRRKSQPLGAASAGCWFKNPAGDSAGRLIDAAGLIGMTCGGARVSDVHANFLVNTGSATAADFLELAEMVRQGVRERFGIELEDEVRVIHG
ncbi:MAG: UDP-N-acetylmuramate dehydrogenase [bacterium]|nr:UDP-N-acetylmuramate dehydrogenase [bacterium]MDT8395280.1 UDP-N-acetylmuramate dehydrogenase [bacterium]